VPAAALVHALGWRPMAGLPPSGLGEVPAHGPRDHVRHLADNVILRRIAARDGLPALNRARRELGLRPLRSWFDQYDAAARVLVLVSEAFDFPARRLAPNVRYVGTPFDDADVPTTTWGSPWPDSDRPLVLISLSTLAQGEAPLMKRILTALAPLPVHAVVTLGPSFDRTDFTVPTERGPGNVCPTRGAVATDRSGGHAVRDGHAGQGLGARVATGLHPTGR
jgi:UDP:flavonoid glycosyltransferase YjiC (YdhE family)